MQAQIGYPYKGNQTALKTQLPECKLLRELPEFEQSKDLASV